MWIYPTKNNKSQHHLHSSHKKQTKQRLKIKLNQKRVLQQQQRLNQNLTNLFYINHSTSLPNIYPLSTTKNLSQIKKINLPKIRQTSIQKSVRNNSLSSHYSHSLTYSDNQKRLANFKHLSAQKYTTHTQNTIKHYDNKNKRIDIHFSGKIQVLYAENTGEFHLKFQPLDLVSSDFEITTPEKQNTKNQKLVNSQFDRPNTSKSRKMAKVSFGKRLPKDMIKKGRQLLAQNKIDEAILEFKEAVLFSSNNRSLLDSISSTYHLGSAYVMKMQPVEAVSTLVSATQYFVELKNIRKITKKEKEQIVKYWRVLKLNIWGFLGQPSVSHNHVWNSRNPFFS